MGIYLHNDEKAFLETIDRVSRSMGMKSEFIVKDYFTVLLLREIVARNPAVVFKGGTCLSKCYGVIDRFSEDVDLGMEVERATEGMRRRLKKCVVDSLDVLGLPVLNLDQTRSRREFNRYIARIPFGFGQEDTLIVETAVMSPTSPVSERPIESFIGSYLREHGRDDLAERYGLEVFWLTVNSLERTFCDKVFAVCDYVLANEPLHRQSRHIYDLCRLLEQVKLDDSFIELFDAARRQRQGGHRTPSANSAVRVSDVLARIVVEESYRDDYESVTYPLLYEVLGYEEAIQSLTKVSAFLECNGR